MCIVCGNDKLVCIDVVWVEKFLGLVCYFSEELFDCDCVGVSIGFVWIVVGGDIFLIEVVVFFGEGKFIFIG